MPPVEKEEVVRLLGPISDHTIAEVLGAGADAADFEEIAMRLEQQDDVMGELRKPLSALAARIYDIILRDPLYAADAREERPDSK